MIPEHQRGDAAFSRSRDLETMLPSMTGHFTGSDHCPYREVLSKHWPSSPMLELIGDSLGCPLRRFRITQVIVADRLQVVGELIDQRNPSGDVEFSNLVFRDIVEEHDHRAQGIPVCSDDHALAAPNDRGDYLPAVGQSTAIGIFQRLGQRDFLRYGGPRNAGHCWGHAGRRW